MKKLILTFMLGILISLACLSTVQALTIKSVDISPREIAPGETAEIEVTLENNLNEDAEDISVSLVFRELVKDSFGNVVSVNEVPFAPYGSSNEETIGELKDDKSKRVNFKIIALTDTKSGIYKLPLQIIYYDEDGDKHEKDSLISITVNSEPIIGVSAEDGLLLKGQENEVRVKVINKGLSDVKFLEVEIGSSTYYTILSQKEVYIGDIDSDDFDSADFSLYFKDNALSILNIPVSVSYKDALNNEYIEDFNLPVKVYTRKKAIELGLLEQSRTPIYAGVAGGLVILYIVYRKIKKRRKLKKVKEG